MADQGNEFIAKTFSLQEKNDLSDYDYIENYFEKLGNQLSSDGKFNIELFQRWERFHAFGHNKKAILTRELTDKDYKNINSQRALRGEAILNKEEVLNLRRSEEMRQIEDWFSFLLTDEGAAHYPEKWFKYYVLYQVLTKDKNGKTRRPNTSMHFVDLHQGALSQVHQELTVLTTSEENRMLNFFDTGWFLMLSAEHQKRVVDITRVGFTDEGNGMEVGVYAMQPGDYTDFSQVFDPIINSYHNIDNHFRFKSDWNIDGKDLDLKNIDPKLTDVSMRVRVARSVEGFPMTGSMTREDRVKFENYMVQNVFEKMINNPKYGGRYISLTPGSKYEITPEEYKTLVNNHQMFKDMDSDKYLRIGGISADWPHGRGMYISKDEQKIVWVGEEDQLRIMNMQVGSDLGLIFNGLREELDFIESLGVPFAVSEKYGNVTSCPSNAGTGMRASLHLKLPNLTEKGQNVDKLKGILKEAGINVSVRGANGEHSAAGEDGLVDVSPRGRMIPENVVITQLYEAASKLLSLENKAN